MILIDKLGVTRILEGLKSLWIICGLLSSHAKMAEQIRSNRVIALKGSQ